MTISDGPNGEDSQSGIDMARSTDQSTRLNVATAFTTARSRAHAAAGREILKRLETDERKPIQRAVKRALTNLSK